MGYIFFFSSCEPDISTFFFKFATTVMSLIELYNGSREMGTLPALVLNVLNL